MVRLLILEDEVWISALIKSIIDQRMPDVEVVGTAQSGTQALALMRHLQPDIMLTDIQIPILNGLQTIYQAQKENISCEYIVITGFKDFDFIQQAMRLGVVDYLLKPINEEALCATVAQLCKRIQQKHAALNQVQNSRSIIEQAFLRECIYHAMTPHKVLQKYGFSLQEGCYCVCLLKYIHRILPHVCLNPHALGELAAFTKRTMKAELSAQLYHYYLIEQGSYMLILLHYPQGMDTAVQQVLQHCFDEILQQSRQHSITCAMGVSETTNQLSDVKDCYTQAVRAIDARGAVALGRLIRYPQDIPENFNIEPLLDEASQNKIKHLLYQNNPQELARFVGGLFDSYVQKNQIIERETLHALDFVRALFECFFPLLHENADAYQSISHVVTDNIEDCKTMSDLKRRILEIFKNCVTEFHVASASKTAHSSINQALIYIDAHLSESISLEEVAQTVFLNPTYFSGLFKQETGRTFRDYMIQTRIDRAKNLLIGTNQKIGAIANQVGYEDVRYFSKTFKKMVGITPKEFRQIHC